MDLLHPKHDPFRIKVKTRRSFWWYVRRFFYLSIIGWLIYVIVLANRSCSHDNRYDNLVFETIDQVQPVPPKGKPRLGIAFGGGGVRGFMHLGAVKALEEAGIRADLVVGSSAGAIAAIMYSTSDDFDAILNKANSMNGDDAYKLTFNKRGLVSGVAIADRIQRITNNANIQDLNMPTGITVTDIETHTTLLASKGNVGEAVQASVSIPGIFMPVKSNHRVLVDGGVFSPVPVKYARAMGADIVIGIDIYCGGKPALKDFFMSTLLVTTRVQLCENSKAETNSANFVIRPTFEPTRFGNFSEQQQMIEAGYNAMKAHIPELKAQLGKP